LYEYTILIDQLSKLMDDLPGGGRII